MTYASSLANLMRTIGFDYNGGLLIEGIGMPDRDALFCWQTLACRSARATRGRDSGEPGKP